MPPRDRPTFWLVLSVLAASCALVFIGFVGMISTYSASNDARRYARDSTKLLGTIEYNSARGDCNRGVQADADEEFRKEISAFLDAGIDAEKRAAVRDRMRAQPNWADTAKKVCPPALKDG